MEQRKVIDILKDAHPESIKRLVHKLNTDGIVSDEDDCLLSSFMIECWRPECGAYLVEKGYVGSSLNKNGKFFPLHGAVYVLFDSGKHTDTTSLGYMTNHVENYEY